MATVLIKRLLIQWTRRLNTLICCFSEADISSESFIISFELSSTKHEVKLRSYMAVTYYAKINRLNSCEKKKPEAKTECPSFRDSNPSPLPIKPNFFLVEAFQYIATKSVFIFSLSICTETVSNPK